MATQTDLREPGRRAPASDPHSENAALQRWAVPLLVVRTVQAFQVPQGTGEPRRTKARSQQPWGEGWSFRSPWPGITNRSEKVQPDMWARKSEDIILPKARGGLAALRPHLGI